MPAKILRTAMLRMKEMSASSKAKRKSSQVLFLLSQRHALANMNVVAETLHQPLTLPLPQVTYLWSDSMHVG